jgi:transketolase
MTPEKELDLQRKAADIRKGILTATYSAQSGHPGGSLSAADMFTYLFNEQLNIDPKNPKWDDRDRFVLSKGHVSPGYYATLANRGFFPVEDLKTFRSIDSYLQGHPNMNTVPGVDMSTGSLGQGLSAAAGMAKGAKILNKPIKVYALLGDGEVAEGQIWEATMFSAHYKLDNLCIIVDVNGLQIDGATKDVMNSAPLDKKFAAFGCDVITIDGHSFPEIESAFAKFAENQGKEKPTVILMNTTKGKGVSFMENDAGWHGKAPNKEEYEKAVAEIDAALAKVEEGAQA